jgi:hypothetical protein
MKADDWRTGDSPPRQLSDFLHPKRPGHAPGPIALGNAGSAQFIWVMLLQVIQRADDTESKVRCEECLEQVLFVPQQYMIAAHVLRIVKWREDVMHMHHNARLRWQDSQIFKSTKRHMGTGCGIGNFIHFGTLQISGACQRYRGRANGDIEDADENNRSNAIHRRSNLQGLPSGLYASHDIASKVSDFLVAQQYFKGTVRLNDSLESYVLEVLLRDEDAQIMDALFGVMAETNAEFGLEFGEYEVIDTVEGEDAVTLNIQGEYCGSADPDRPFCGDQIDVIGTVELTRVAGHVAFAEPDISVTGEVNQDWVDPELRFGKSGSPRGQLA